MFHGVVLRPLRPRGLVVPADTVAYPFAHPLPLGELAHVVAQHGCVLEFHQHMPLRVQSVPVTGGVNVLVDMAMQSSMPEGETTWETPSDTCMQLTGLLLCSLMAACKTPAGKKWFIISQVNGCS